MEVYKISVTHPNFAPVSQLVEIRSAIPKELKIALSLNRLTTTVDVNTSDTLDIDLFTSQAAKIASARVVSPTALPLCLAVAWQT